MREKRTPSSRWTPEHWMQVSTPRLVLSHVGSAEERSWSAQAGPPPPRPPAPAGPRPPPTCSPAVAALAVPRPALHLRDEQLREVLGLPVQAGACPGSGAATRLAEESAAQCFVLAVLQHRHPPAHTEGAGGHSRAPRLPALPTGGWALTPHTRAHPPPGSGRSCCLPERRGLQPQKPRSLNRCLQAGSVPAPAPRRRQGVPGTCCHSPTGACTSWSPCFPLLPEQSLKQLPGSAHHNWTAPARAGSLLGKQGPGLQETLPPTVPHAKPNWQDALAGSRAFPSCQPVSLAAPISTLSGSFLTPHSGAGLPWGSLYLSSGHSTQQTWVPLIPLLEWLPQGEIQVFLSLHLPHRGLAPKAPEDKK